MNYCLQGVEHEKQDKVQVLSLYWTSLGFISKNEEYNTK